MTSGPRVLYVAYWGAGEPLGQSLVLPAVKRLAAEGVRLTLVTFDKPNDYADGPRMQAIRRDLDAAGVRWIALRYHKRPRLPATGWDIVHGWARGVLSSLRERPDIVHGRTFIGGIIGRILAGTLRTRFVFHNEGFYPDEQVDGGFWAAGSTMHRATTSVERSLYARADGLVVLSHRAQAVLERMPAVARRQTPIVVVPSCVDLDVFGAVDRAPRAASAEVRFIYTGAVGGRYGIDRVGRFVATAARRRDVSLRVLSRADPTLVGNMLTAGGLTAERWSQGAVPHAQMPAELAKFDAGLFFLTQGLSEHGCSPTKVGEYWACGLPVVTTPNVSDLDDLIARHRVGVVLRGHTDEDYAAGFDELLALMRDPGLASRCREAAAGHYSLQPAVERQRDLYGRLRGER